MARAEAAAPREICSLVHHHREAAPECGLAAQPTTRGERYRVAGLLSGLPKKSGGWLTHQRQAQEILVELAGLLDVLATIRRVVQALDVGRHSAGRETPRRGRRPCWHVDLDQKLSNCPARTLLRLFGGNLGEAFKGVRNGTTWEAFRRCWGRSALESGTVRRAPGRWLAAGGGGGGRSQRLGRTKRARDAAQSWSRRGASNHHPRPHHQGHLQWSPTGTTPGRAVSSVAGVATKLEPVAGFAVGLLSRPRETGLLHHQGGSRGGPDCRRLRRARRD